MENLGRLQKLPLPAVERLKSPPFVSEGRLPKVRLNISERRVLLAVVDVLVLSAALLATLSLRYGTPLRWSTISGQLGYYLILIGIWAVCATLFECYDLPKTARASQSAWAGGRAALTTALIYLVIPMYTPHFPASRMSSFLFVGLITISVPAWRVLYAAVFSQPLFQQRILVVGAGRSGRVMARTLAQAPQYGNPYAGSGYLALGFVDDDPEKANTLVEGIPVLGTGRDLPRLVRKHDIDLVVVAITHPTHVQPELFQSLLESREYGVFIESMASMCERLTGRILVQHAGRDLSIVMPVPDSPMRHVFCTAKRLVDLVASICGLGMLLLLAPCIAVANRFRCPGPLFYPQVRVGKGGKKFTVYKFRSMIPAAEKDCGAVWACAGDDRVTAVGRILRKTRLDEIPQFWNVLKGEMSLVGPRPERPEFVSTLAQELPFYQSRHAVRPGITGWAQVRYPYGSSIEDALAKLEYDLYYVKHQSLYLELSILIKTAVVMLGLKGR